MLTRLLPFIIALAFAPSALAGGPTMQFGAAEDVVRTTDLPAAKAKMTLLRLAGFSAVRVTSQWQGTEATPSETELTVLRNVAGAAQLSAVRVYLSIYPTGSRVTPLTPEARELFAAYVTSLKQQLPSIRDVIIGNEPNINRFWLPQFDRKGKDVAAPAYELLLARSYDAIKAVAPSVEVVGGALSHMGINKRGSGRDTIAPQKFLLDLGKAYRETKRQLPIMDAFAFHPYLEHANLPPTYKHYSPRVITIADYGRLVSLLGRAFDGTAQEGSKLPIIYAEFGVESRIPDALLPAYTGTEPATTRPVNESVQARFYAKAMQMAACQPTVRTFLVFRLIDEAVRGGWQSGVYYANGSPKASLPGVEEAARRLAEQRPTACTTVLAPKPLVSYFPVRRPTARFPTVKPVSLLCDADCRYELRLMKGSSVVADVRGKAIAGVRKKIGLTPNPLTPGTYRIMVRAKATAFRANEFVSSRKFTF